MEQIHIRTVHSRKELEDIYEIWDTVFPRGKSFFQDRLEFDTTYSTDTTWVAIVDGVIAAAIQLFTFRIRFGSLELKLGGIGSVATLPAYRKRGLAQRILRRISEYMKQNGYDLSLLNTNILSFYEQVGWFPYSKKVWSAKAETIMQLDHSTLYAIRRYEDTDLESITVLYEEANREVYGSVIRSKTYWLGQQQWKTVQPHQFLVAETEGTVVAFLRYKSNGNQLQLADCCCLPGHEEAARSLLCRAVAEHPEDSSISAYLPDRHALEACFRQHGNLQIETNSMWKIVDFGCLLSKLAPEFSRRMLQGQRKENFVLPAALLVGLGDQEMIIRMRKEEVEVVRASESTAYNISLQLNEAQWIMLLLNGYSTLEDQSTEGMPYLSVLFPEISSVFWNADNF
ncbi:GNAT family N-acetyltransferase [Paenibacillus sp. CGMCC 1.16610]|uniref:GNAT family N-acetyltransferase n=1 Tax=Paenibacillus anseongense TaxID=2682845 RepID=A0ABW9U5L2_9BACL|nr:MULTISPECIES: GNAT family N-acetyltransferase [Paenibacillus]MBA2938725.1 GNAT family N-acetyltransferase [Paenibacillus sp. CGMCC 1.16610]MVQ34688.1 GNAT family N-acetyltransferase [Paenibacillus anseongense]